MNYAISKTGSSPLQYFTTSGDRRTGPLGEWTALPERADKWDQQSIAQGFATASVVPTFGACTVVELPVA